MTEDYISLETAKLANKKGFNEKVSDCFYFTADNVKEEQLYPLQIAPINHIPRPTQSFLQKWLREKHEIILFISPIGSKPVKYLAVIPHCYVNKDVKGLGVFDSYEQALEAALQQALNIIP